MNLEIQYKKPNLASEPFFYFNSGELKENISFVKEKNIPNLMLINNANGYNLKNLDFLQELPFVKKVSMGACPQIENFEGLNYLLNLTSLIIAPNKKYKVNLSNLTRIEYLGISFSKNIVGLDCLENLVWLGVDNGTDDLFDIKIFEHYTKLKELRISNSMLTNLLFLKKNTILEYLELNHIKRTLDLDGLLYVKDSIRRLKLISSKKIDNSHLISQLVNLEWLILNESITLENAKIIQNLEKLEALTLGGSSYFVDGDLRDLKEMKNKIKYFNVSDKKHYFYD